MRISRYVTNVETEAGDKLLHSGLSGAVLRLSKEQEADLAQLLCEQQEGPETHSLREHAMAKVKRALRQAMIVVDDAFDEMDYIRHEAVREKLTAVPVFSIAPTMACNLRCPYCYNPSRGHVMSQDTQDHVVSFITSQLKRREADAGRVLLNWIGGEPLLAYDVMERLGNRIGEVAEELRYEIESTLFTNGVLLDAERASALAAYPLRVQYVQVCLDGPASVHNRSRVGPNKEPTYERICDNIIAAKKYLPIIVRLNATSEYTIEHGRALIEDLVSRHVLVPGQKSSSIALGRVHEACASTNAGPSVMSLSEYASRQMEFAALCQDMSLPHAADRLLCAPKGTFCMAMQEGSWTIDAEGKLHKCWEFMGAGTALGDVRRGYDQNNASLQQWVERDFTNNTECAACQVLPLCGGGCPAFALTKGETSPDRCHPMRYGFKERIRMKYLPSQNKASVNTNEDKE